MSEQLFKEIHSIEEEAEKLISQSEKQSADILKKANTEAFQILSDKDYELKELRDKTIRKTLEETSEAKEAKLKKTHADLKNLRHEATKNKEKAVNLVINKLSELIGE